LSEFKQQIKSIEQLIDVGSYGQAKEALDNLALTIANKLEEIHKRRDELVKKMKSETGVKVAVDKENEAFKVVFSPDDDLEKKKYFEEYNKLMSEVNNLEVVLTQVVVLIDKVEEELRLRGKGPARFR